MALGRLAEVSPPVSPPPPARHSYTRRCLPRTELYPRDLIFPAVAIVVAVSNVGAESMAAGAPVWLCSETDHQGRRHE